MNKGCVILDQSKMSISTRWSDSLGSMIITNLVIPNGAHFDPLGKLWAQFRRRVKSWYKISIVGIFVYNDKTATISCTFYQSYTPAFEGQTESQMKKAFIDHFGEVAEKFDCLITDFINSPQFAEYTKQFALGANKTALSGILNEFLLEAGIRTKSDEKRSARENALEAARVAAARANREAAKASTPPPADAGGKN